MPRRIIYIKNPSAGSHFRTLGASGGGGSKPPTTKPPKPTPPPPDFGIGAIGYGGNFTQGPPSWENWYNTFPNTTQIPPEAFSGPGNMPIPENWGIEIFSGLSPEQFYQLQWDQHSGLGFWFWYFQTLAEGINPATGAVQPPYRTPGQLNALPSLPYTDLFTDYHFGDVKTVPTQYWGTTDFGSAYQAYLRSLGE